MSRDFSDYTLQIERSPLAGYILLLEGFPLPSRAKWAEELQSSQVSPPDLSAALAEADPILERLKVPRHKLFAHRDYTSTWNDVFDAAGLTRPELTRLVELTVSMASAISVWYENTHPDFSSLAPADAQMLIERLKEPT